MKALVLQIVQAVYFGALLIFVAGSLVLSGGLFNTSNLISFVTSLVLLVDPIQGVGKAYNELKQGEPAIERLFDLTRFKPQVIERSDAIHIDSIKGEVKFCDISFQYRDGLPLVLNGVDLHIKAGEVVALVSPSGGGKTTLAKLLLRLYDPMNGIDLEKVKLAAKTANADEFVSVLPRGYETHIGSRGSILSGGQKQRYWTNPDNVNDFGLLMQMEDSLEKSLDQIQRQKNFDMKFTPFPMEEDRVLRCINAFNCEIVSIYFNVFPIDGTGSYCEGNMRRNNSRFLWIFRQPLNIKYYLTALPSRKWMAANYGDVHTVLETLQVLNIRLDERHFMKIVGMSLKDCTPTSVGNTQWVQLANGSVGVGSCNRVEKSLNECEGSRIEVHVGPVKEPPTKKTKRAGRIKSCVEKAKNEKAKNEKGKNDEGKNAEAKKKQQEAPKKGKGKGVKRKENADPPSSGFGERKSINTFGAAVVAY
ncbi:hypothetical protein BVRB_9g208700 [Beta vulgaris subsp. vulgaris]|nr:hypothetical protein BVRB_9g208700 [Beta vulgaris subsp. vulgaris]